MLIYASRPRSWHKLRLCVSVVLLALPLVLPAGATSGEGDDGSSGNGAHVQMVERNGVRYYTASTSASSGRASPLGSLSFMAAPQSIIAIGSGYTVRFTNQISANAGAARWVRYNYAETRRLSGSGDYRAEAHATLIKGNSYENDPVFDAFDPRCAGISRVNRTARTCSSARFATSPGEEWFVISGHSYDHGNDGIVNKRIAGGMDYVWTASRR